MNWRYRKFGEVDIIAKKDGVTVFSEVKLRKNNLFAPACAAVNRKKQNKIRCLAEIYLTMYEVLRDTEVRFDVVQVYTEGELTRSEDCKPVVDIIENAF